MRNGKLHRWRWGMDTFIERKDQIEVLEKRGNYSVCFKQSGFNAPKNIHNFTVGTLEIKDIATWTEADEQLCEELGVDVNYSETDFIFILESWGQLPTDVVVKTAIEHFNDKLKEFGKLLK